MEPTRIKNDGIGALIGALAGILSAWLLFDWHMPGGLLPAFGLVVGWRLNHRVSLRQTKTAQEGQKTGLHSRNSLIQEISAWSFLLFLILAIIIQSPKLGLNQNTSDTGFLLFGGLACLSGFGYLYGRGGK